MKFFFNSFQLYLINYSNIIFLQIQILPVLPFISSKRYLDYKFYMSKFNWFQQETKKTSTKRSKAQIDNLYDMNLITEEINYVYNNKPHRKDPKFFQKVKISILALIKMLNHTLMGGNIEVMGILQGYYNRKGEFFIMDSLALPVEAT